MRRHERPRPALRGSSWELTALLQVAEQRDGERFLRAADGIIAVIAMRYCLRDVRKSSEHAAIRIAFKIDEVAEMLSHGSDLWQPCQSGKFPNAARGRIRTPLDAGFS